MSYRDPASPDATATPVTTATATVVTSNLSLSLHPKLKPSLSSQDLKEVGKQEMKKTDPLPEYYNLFVPRLPANLKEGGSMEDRNRKMHATLSSFQAPSVSLLGATGPRLSSGGSQSERGDDRVGAEPQKTPSPKTQERNEEDEEDDDDDKVLVDPSLAAHSSHAHSEGVAPPTGLAPHYDHLELVRMASGNQTTRFSHSPSPENLSRSSTPRPAHLYNQLPLKDTSPPSNEGGANGGKVSVPYERKVGVLGHTHTYEYIEVMLKGGGSRVPGPQISNLPCRQNSDPAMSDSDTPVSETPVNEHPSQWTTLADSAHSRSPGSHSRKKPLPLQGVPLDESFTGKSLQEQLPPERVAPPPAAAWARKNDQGEQEVGVAGGVASQRAESASPIPPRPPARHAHQHSVDSLDGGPPRGPLLRGTSTQSTEETPPVPPRSRDTSFTVSLPATEIQFDKPLVPPKPRVLEHKPSNSSLPSGVQYATMRFTNSSDDHNYAQVYPNQRLAPPTTSGGARGGKEGGGDPSKVVYQSVDFEVTEGLRKTREDVEYQRSREIEWLLLQGELTVLKTLTAK